jgi:hypothetical protein
MNHQFISYKLDKYKQKISYYEDLLYGSGSIEEESPPNAKWPVNDSLEESPPNAKWPVNDSLNYHNQNVDIFETDQLEYKIPQNDIFNKAHHDRKIFEKMFYLFIDKIVIHAIASYTPSVIGGIESKLVICGGKALGFYTHFFDVPDELKSFDYDIHVVGRKTNQMLNSDNGLELNQEHIYTILKHLRKRCNKFLSKHLQKNLYIAMYNILVNKFNKQSESIELIEIDESHLSNMFKCTDTSGIMYSRKGTSVYLKIKYKIKSFYKIANDESKYDNKRISRDDLCENYKKLHTPKIIERDVIYETGIGVVDLLLDKTLPHFRILNNKKVELCLKNKDIQSISTRKCEGHYNSSIDVLQVYVPHFDIVYMNILVNALHDDYSKQVRNQAKIDYLSVILKSPLRYLNLSAFFKKGSFNVITDELNLRWYEIYKHFYTDYKQKIIENGVSFISGILEEFRIEDKENNDKGIIHLLQQHLLLSNIPDRYGKPTICSHYINHYDTTIGNFDNDYRKISRDEADILSQYVYGSNRYNIPLITGNTQEDVNGMTIREYAKKFMTIMNSYKIAVHDSQFKDFYVYSVSQTHAIDSTKNGMFIKGETYTFPSFKSTTYAKHYSDHPMFIGFENQPFVMRIHIDPKKISGKEFIFMGGSQYEVVLSYGAQVKVVDINRCYTHFIDEYRESELVQSSLLIDCELLKMDDSMLHRISLRLNNVQQNEQNEQYEYYNDIIASNQQTGGKYKKSNNKIINKIKNKTDTDSFEFDRFIKRTSEKIKKNNLIIYDASLGPEFYIKQNKKML